jgi:ABC-type multidrug transport system fused ATPase/permease subunit
MPGFPGDSRVSCCGFVTAAASPSAGKSSLIGALFRLTEIESGLITIDGINTKALALRQLRASMALIPQVRLARRS